MRDDFERLTDIAEAIARIERYASLGREELDRNELIQTWYVHHIQIIGEAVRVLSDAARQLRPDVPWNQIVGMRHVLVHQYFGIDLDRVWNVVDQNIPPLKAAIESMLQSLRPADLDSTTTGP